MLGRVCGFSNCFLNVKSPKIIIRLRRMEKSELTWEPNFFVAVGVLPVELLPYQVSMVSAKDWPRYVYLYT